MAPSLPPPDSKDRPSKSPYGRYLLIMKTPSDEDQAEGPAKARRSRRKALAPVAVLALLIGGIGVWRLLDHVGSDDEVHVTGPADVSRGPALEWTEFDPGLGNTDYLGPFEPLGDGRILVRSLRFEDNERPVLNLQYLVTENGVDWSEVPMPSDIAPLSYDLSGNRWLVAGYDFTGGLPQATEESEDSQSQSVSEFRAFFSDNQGASWTELEFDWSSSSLEEPPTDEQLPLVASTALTSGDHMVIVLQGEEEDTNVGNDPGNGMPSESEEDNRENPKARIFASNGGVFEQVAEYPGWISRGVVGGNVGTPAGFSLQLYIESGTEQERPRQLTLTSPDGRTWSESQSAFSLAPAALGPDGSLVRTAWLGSRYGLHGYDREGTRTTTVAFDNSLPLYVAAGPSGLAVNAMTVPGTDLFTLPNRRIAKEGYELRLNEPQGGFTLWDSATGTAVSECGRDVLWTSGLASAESLESVCQFRHPDVGDDMDAVVMVFEDVQSGTRLVSFTRRELLPSFPLWIITGLDSDGLEAEQWLAWSADGVKWVWQSSADAFGIDPFEADAWAGLAVGDGFVLARVQQFSQESTLQDRWFIAQVP